MPFSPGQRWFSLTEPELGLGIVRAAADREVEIAYPARDVVRRYAAADAPLQRAVLSPGQTARSVDGHAFTITRVHEEGDLLRYAGEDASLLESELDAALDVSTPENRLRNAQVDPVEDFALRRQALAIRHRMLSAPERGFFGGRIRLFDHQLSIAHAVCERHRVRVLLADEVGLGKTIEALLILHRLLLSGRVERALVVVPPALVHQWLAEAYLRFHLVLRVVGTDPIDSEPPDESSTTDAETAHLAWSEAQLFVCPLDYEGRADLVSGDWDLVIVDEAHHLRPDSEAFGAIEALAERTPHLLLLSATPDRDGEPAHFRRLALLDPARFHDADAFHEEAARDRPLVETAERLQRGDP